MLQQTISAPVSVTGIGLHSGKQVTVEICPAPVDTGLVFIRKDLEQQPHIKVSLENFHRQPLRCTCLKTGEVEIFTMEHLTATCVALSLDNLYIYIDGPEVPGMDGSALPFYQALKKVGKKEQEKEVDILVLEELCVEHGNSSLTTMPESSLTLQYFLEHDVAFMKNQMIEFEINEKTFAEQIAPARTFVLRQEAEQLQKMGMGKGANVKNTLVIDDDGSIIDNELRFPDEFARHKMLDLLGDLALSAKRIQGKIVGKRSGHALNAQLVQKLAGNKL